jgi:hypothetical protein
MKVAVSSMSQVIMSAEATDGTDTLFNLASGEADIAARLFQPNEPDVIVRRAFEQTLYVFAPRECVKHYGLPQPHDGLRNHRFILSIKSRLRHRRSSSPARLGPFRPHLRFPRALLQSARSCRLS